MITVGCFSIGTTYEREAALLRQSLDAVGMRHDIRGFPDQGDWYANTAMKAEMICDLRFDIRGPMLYVDVDAFVHQNCTGYFDRLAENGIDFAAHWFAGPAKGHVSNQTCPCIRGGKCDRAHRLLSGTLFFGDTDRARDLLENWCELNQLLRRRGMVQGGGQKNLWYLLTCADGLLTQARLPGRYCFVFDKAWAYPPNEPRIIEHTIASRDNRAGPKVTSARMQRKRELLESLKEA